MKFPRFIGSAVLGMAVFLYAAPADAAHRSDQDIHLNINVAPSLLRHNGSTGRATYAVQEKAHNSLTESTGLEIDHFYIFVNLNGETVAAIDPLCTYDFDRGGTKH